MLVFLVTYRNNLALEKKYSYSHLQALHSVIHWLQYGLSSEIILSMFWSRRHHNIRAIGHNIFHLDT